MRKKLFSCLLMIVIMGTLVLFSGAYENNAVFADDNKYPVSIRLEGIEDVSLRGLFETIDYDNEADLMAFMLKHEPDFVYKSLDLIIGFNDGTYKCYSYNYDDDIWYSPVYDEYGDTIIDTEPCPYHITTKWKGIDDSRQVLVAAVSLLEYPELTDDYDVFSLYTLNGIEIYSEYTSPHMNLKENTNGYLDRDVKYDSDGNLSGFDGDAYYCYFREPLYYYDYNNDEQDLDGIEVRFYSKWAEEDTLYQFIHKCYDEEFGEYYALDLEEYGEAWFENPYYDHSNDDEVIDKFLLYLEEGYDKNLKLGANDVHLCIKPGDKEFRTPITVNLEKNPNATITDNILYTHKEGSYYAQLSEACVEGDILIPDKVTFESGKFIVNHINDYAFSGSHGITSVKLPDTIESIGKGAFLDAKMKMIEIPSSVKTIDPLAIGYVSFFNEDIDELEYEKIPGFVIIGEKGSAAEQYANSNGFTFQIAKKSIDNAVVSINNCVYNGKAQTPAVTVKLNGTVLVRNVDYTIKYSNNVNAGTAKVQISGTGDYCGSCSKAFTIAKAANPIQVNAKTATIKYKTLKKKNQTLAVGKVLTVSKSQGKPTYSKVSGNKKITIDKSSGKVTIKKKLKKGSYKIKVTISTPGNANYNKASKTVTFTVKVK